MHVVCRSIFSLGICTLFIGGCAQSRSSSGVDAGQSQAEKSEEDERPRQKRWSASLHVSYNLLDGKEREHEIVQGENSLDVIGITEDEWPIVEARFGKILSRFSLEVYLNPKATLKGVLFRSKLSNDVWTQTLFTNWKGWERWEKSWKLVSGEAPDKEEWWWKGTYRTDGETLYFDSTNENGSHCTWMLMTKAPRKSRKDASP